MNTKKGAASSRKKLRRFAVDVEKKGERRFGEQTKRGKAAHRLRQKIRDKSTCPSSAHDKRKEKKKRGDGANAFLSAKVQHKISTLPDKEPLREKSVRFSERGKKGKKEDSYRLKERAYTTKKRPIAMKERSFASPSRGGRKEKR